MLGETWTKGNYYMCARESDQMVIIGSLSLFLLIYIYQINHRGVGNYEQADLET